MQNLVNKEDISALFNKSIRSNCFPDLHANIVALLFLFIKTNYLQTGLINYRSSIVGKDLLSTSSHYEWHLQFNMRTPYSLAENLHMSMFVTLFTLNYEYTPLSNKPPLF